jgi:hypothetical protein
MICALRNSRKLTSGLFADVYAGFSGQIKPKPKRHFDLLKKHRNPRQTRKIFAVHATIFRFPQGKENLKFFDEALRAEAENLLVLQGQRQMSSNRNSVPHSTSFKRFRDMIT